MLSGPYQNEGGDDGIGDTPYVIDASNTDWHSLISATQSDLNHDGVVDIFDATLLAHAFDSVLGDSNWNSRLRHQQR